MNDNYQTYLKLLGSKIKNRRLEKGLTQLELSILIDCEIKSIQRIEKGKMNMSLKMFKSIYKVLDISPEFLLRDEKQ